MHTRLAKVARVLAWVASLCLVTIAAPAHPPESEAFPAPPVALKVIAPSAKGPWLLRIDNEGDRPIRIAADVRLLTFEVRGPSPERLPLRLAHRHGWQRRATVCRGPRAFAMKGKFPLGRALILEPGHSYVEQFDPRLICFDDDADLLEPGAMVKPYYGWRPNKRPWNEMSSAPFVADDAKKPRQYKPLRRLEAPTMLLSHSPPVEYGPTAQAREVKPAEKKTGADETGKDDAGADEAKEGKTGADETGGEKATAPQRAPDGAGNDDSTDGGSADAEAGGDADATPEPKSAEEASRHRPRAPQRKRPPPPKDELDAAMTLTTDHYEDALRPTGIALGIQAHNVGQRPLFVALRSRMLSFVVVGPDGSVVRCSRRSKNHKVPRDLFRTLHHDKHIHMNVMLTEMCPPRTFERPGLYAVIPTLHADADGAQYGLKALTGTVTVRDPGIPSGTHEAGDDVALVRMRRGSRPFYDQPPQALPTRVLPE